MKIILSRRFLFTLTIVLFFMFLLISIKENTANKETPKRATLVYFNIKAEDVYG